MMSLQTSKVVVIGIDGATFKVIEPLKTEGRLPNISRIMSEGVHGVLNSTIPAVSPVAWTSFMTGRNPDKHSIFDFSARVAGTYNFKINTTKERTAKPLWVLLSESGKRVLVLGVTMTNPPDRVNGYMLSGLGAPTDSNPDAYAYPPGFAAEIDEKIGKYKTIPDGDLRKIYRSDREKDRYINGVFEQIDYRVKLFKYMWQRESFDFSMVFFLDTDGVSHYFWKHMDKNHKRFQPGKYSDAIYRVYEKLDCAIGEILGMVNNEADIVMVSDHGFGPLNRVVFLNNWLESKGYLKFKERSVLKNLLSAVQKEGRKKDIDWSQTKAFFNGTVGNVFINLKGSEPEGTIDPSMYDSICREIKTALLNMEDPENGARIVENVYTRDELFRANDLSPSSPSLVVIFKSGYSVVGKEIKLHGIKDTGEIISDSNNWSGTHDPDGIFIACGQSFKNNYRVKGANIVDVAPTLLYRLGVPIPESMDGKLLDIFNDGFLQDNKVSYIRDDLSSQGREPLNKINEEEEKEVLERLRNLGYIE